MHENYRVYGIYGLSYIIRLGSLLVYALLPGDALGPLLKGLVLDNVTQRLVCAPCPADAVSSWDPRAQHRVCLVCPAGQERRGGRCVHCEAGYFSDTAGADCSPCQPGEFQGRTGARRPRKWMGK